MQIDIDRGNTWQHLYLGKLPIGSMYWSMYGIYANMDPINIPHMLAYIPYIDPMG